jgi:BirA family transcriptional regulator, biotin operon repressor / biotin---[acetyl-CoA-carboxylase] ligase
MHSFGRQFTVLASVDSTNNYAMQKVHARLANHGDVWLALDQTKGKGQRHKQWVSNPGENITMSTVTEPSFLCPSDSFLLVAAVALGIFDFFKQYAGEKTRIKWPNDIYWDDRKAGGILIENVLRNKKWLYAVIGTGVNINQTDFNGYNATSLAAITGKKFDMIPLAKQLCICLEKRYEQLHSGLEDAILEDYKQALYRLNQLVTFKKNDSFFEGLVKGITKNGLLIVTTDIEQHFSWGSVEWITTAQLPL